MSKNFILLLLFLACSFFIIIYIENKKVFNTFINKHRNIFIGIVLIVFIFGFSKEVGLFKDEISKEKIGFDDYTLINKELEFYNKKIKENYSDNYLNPYIPEGFHYVEGEPLSGYVIEDAEGNQYVWVPCSNKELNDVPKLRKKDFFDQEPINAACCHDEDYEDFINSALKYGGYYISRYELGKNGDKVVSKKDMPVIRDISRRNAEEIVNNLYRENKDIKCQLLTGYAYDTMRSWIEMSNVVKANSIDCEAQKEILSGRVEYNHIYDIYDSVLEITDENFFEYVVARGYTYTIEKYDVSKNLSRISLKDIDDNQDIPQNTIAIRAMIYKLGE